MMYLLIYLDILAPLVPLPFLLLKKSRKGWENIILFYLLLQLVLNCTAKYMMLRDLNNIYIYIANAFLSFVTLVIFFANVFLRFCSERFFRGFLVYCAVSLLLLVSAIIFDNTHLFNSLSYSFTAFSIFVFCLLYYILRISHPGDETAILTGRSWAINGFFVYYGGNFIIFVIYKVLTKEDPSKFKFVWGVHNIIFLIFCCIILIAVKWSNSKTYS